MALAGCSPRVRACIPNVLISRDQVIAGLPAPDVRRLMRALMRGPQTLGGIGAESGLDDSAVAALIAELEGAALIEPVSGETWRTTVAGNALAKARIGKPMRRSKADQLVADLLNRIAEVNADEAFPYTVEDVRVFGSYANPMVDGVGDVDLQILYALRPDVDLGAYNRVAVNLAKRDGRNFSTYLDVLAFTETQFYRRVRGRSNRLDIQFDLVDSPGTLPDGAKLVELYRRAGGSAALVTADPIECRRASFRSGSARTI